MPSFDFQIPKNAFENGINPDDVKRLTSYLFMLNEQLRYQFSHIDDENISDKSVTSAKIADNAVTGKNIAPGAITAESRIIAPKTIKIDDLQEPTVNSLSANALEAITARIIEIVSQNITTDTLYSNLATLAKAQITTANIDQANIAWASIEELVSRIATIAKAQITTANIATANIDWATISNLTASIASIAKAQISTANIINANINWAEIAALSASIASIAKAQITTANITNADIDWASIQQLKAAMAEVFNAEINAADIDLAHVKDLTTDTAIITRGVGERLYITRLAVTEANMVSLTVGELVVKGEDGHFYSVSVNESGDIQTAIKQISNEDVADLSINANTKLIENSVTAKTLNAQDVFANSAIIKSLIAANLDVDVFFAREALIGKIKTAHLESESITTPLISPSAKNDLTLAAKTAIQPDIDALGERVSTAELKIKPSAIVQTVVQSTTYTDRQVEIDDEISAANDAAAVADQKATNAQNTANSKNRTYQQATAPTNPVSGDLWINTASGKNNELKRWNGTAWVLAQDERLANTITRVQQELTNNGIYNIVSQNTGYINALNEKASVQSVSELNTTVGQINLRVNTTENNISGLGNRMNAAEQKITDTAIVQTVTQSAAYTQRQAAIDSGIAGAQQQVSSVEQRTTPEAITATVRSSAQYVQDIDGKASHADLAGLATRVEVQEINQTTVQQTDDKLAVAIQQERARAQQVEGEIKTFTDQAQTYFEFTIDGLLTGKADSPFKTLSGNAKYSFLQNGVEVAYIQYNKLYILAAHVLDVLTLGNASTGYTDIMAVPGGVMAKWRAN